MKKLLGLTPRRVNGSFIWSALALSEVMRVGLSPLVGKLLFSLWNQEVYFHGYFKILFPRDTGITNLGEEYFYTLLDSSVLCAVVLIMCVCILKINNECLLKVYAAFFQFSEEAPLKNEGYCLVLCVKFFFLSSCDFYILKEELWFQFSHVCCVCTLQWEVVKII